MNIFTPLYNQCTRRKIDKSGIFRESSIVTRIYSARSATFLRVARKGTAHLASLTHFTYVYVKCTSVYRMYIRELSRASPKCTRISHKRLIRLSGRDVGSICAPSSRSRARERNGCFTDIFFPYFSLFSPERSKLRSDRKYSGEDRDRRRREIRAGRPIPLKVSPMENRRRCADCRREKARTRRRRAEGRVVSAPAARVFSSTCIRRLNLSPVDRAVRWPTRLNIIESRPVRLHAATTTYNFASKD